MRRAALLLTLLAACGLASDADLVPGPSAGTAPWTDLGEVVACLGPQTLGPAPGGLCVRADSAAIACTTDTDCASRQQCVCGRCVVQYCAASADCVAPRFCNFAEHRCDLPCSEGCARDEQCLGGVCRGRCLDTTDCQFGEVCDANTCIGDDCAADTDCLFGERCELERMAADVREPAPVRTDTAILLYFELADQIWRARSTDGVHFVVDPEQPVLAGAAPSVVIDGDTTYLYIEDAGGISVATATDGIAFTAPQPVLTGDVHAPAAIHAGDTVLLYYASNNAIGLATGPTRGPLADAGPVLAPAAVEVGDGTPGTAFWTPITALASPAVVVAGPDRTIHLYFAGFGVESAPGTKFGDPAPIPPNFSIGFAAAPVADPGALAVWPYGPVFDHVETLLEHHDERGPGVVEIAAGRFRMYYVDATVGRLGVLGSGPL